MGANEISILECQVEQLDLTDESIAFLKAIKINRLQDLTGFGWQQIRNDKDFDYILFNEVVSFLRNNDLLYLMEPPD